MPQRGWNKDGGEGIYLMEGELNQKVPHLVATNNWKLLFKPINVRNPSQRFKLNRCGEGLKNVDY